MQNLTHIVRHTFWFLGTMLLFGTLICIWYSWVFWWPGDTGGLVTWTILYHCHPLLQRILCSFLCCFHCLFFYHLGHTHWSCLGALMLLLDIYDFLSPISHMIYHCNYKLPHKWISLYPEISGGLIPHQKSFIFPADRDHQKIYNWSNCRQQQVMEYHT